MSLSDNKALVERFFSAAGAGKFDLLHDDVTFFVAGDMEGCGLLDHEGITKLYTILTRDAAGEFRITPTHMIAEGNFVAVEAVGHLELTNGRIYNNHYHIVFEVDEGKIRRIREYSDTDHLRRTYDLTGSATR
ncbi:MULTISPECIES: nuclear transport factor 2 family protein [Sphingobium]|uniref:nuclear transport factor 2 family protein n=1 Tax=Sphingobium sp. MI1205 TaxID=407020 RepID=UPI00077045D3|nr:nuclear transport factor 2 family protein [Sphingobium sp. MI1205]AMK19585.1 hypothetical protein K663_16035 [Sphingobium sp. MI1205]